MLGVQGAGCLGFRVLGVQGPPPSPRMMQIMPGCFVFRLFRVLGVQGAGCLGFRVLGVQGPLFPSPSPIHLVPRVPRH